MRLTLVLCLVLLFLNCEDNKSKQKTIPSVKKEPQKAKVEKPKDTVVAKTREFPLLDSKNVMDFLGAYGEENKENKVRLHTRFGTIDILLFEKTKYHRANFIYLTKQGIFDNTQFHRVVKNFVIQGGNTDQPKIANKRKKIGRYLLPPDTKRGYKHHRGVISMPSSEIKNAYKLASPYEFFITQSNQYHLDGQYTIFGKVIRGMSVVDKINSQETDAGDWPTHNIYINKAEVLN